MAAASWSVPDPTAGPVSIAVVGDWISEADSNNFSAGDLGVASWVSHAVGDGAR